MKKGLFIILMMLFCFVAKAQLLVDYFGHTAVGNLQNTSALFNVSSKYNTF